MKLVKCDLPAKMYKRTKIQKYLDEFLDMNVSVCRVEFSITEYASATSLYDVFKKAIKRLGYHQIECHVVDKEVYLFNTYIKED